MNPRLTEEILRSCPNLYGKHQDGRTFRSFEVADGWFEVIREASRKLEEQILKLPKELRVEVRMAQVKEKFGGLRIYMTGHLPESQEIIRAAEEAASKTCETCGLEGSGQNVKGCYMVICPIHLEEEKKRRKS